MPLTLTTAEAVAITQLPGITDNDISVAKALIAVQTDSTVDEHVDSRLIDSALVKTAWAVVAGRVHQRAGDEAAGATTAESQDDYSYSQSVTLANHIRFRQLVDGYPEELLNIARGVWQHI